MKFFDTVPVNLHPITPTPTLNRVYPYYSVDLMAALEISEEKAWEVVWEAQRRVKNDNVLVFSAIVEDINDHAGYPHGEFVDSGEVRNIYFRKWVEYEDVEFIWHVHDGYGREAGTVELTVWN